MNQKSVFCVSAYALVFVIVLIFAGALRIHTFWLPHWRGDQGQYVTLAMKLDSVGLKGYNLRESKLQMIPVQKDPLIVLTVVSHGNIGQPGDLLDILTQFNQSYYDEPLHMRAPLFPYVIMLAHNFFAQPNQPFVVCSSNLGKAVLKTKPYKILQAQFWLAIVPFSTNLMIIAMICLFGWLLFADKRVGLYAGLIMAVNPLSIWLAHRVLNENLAVALVVLSLLVFKGLNARKHLVLAGVSGVMGGLAVLTNQKMGLILCIVFIYAYFCRWEELGGRLAKGWSRVRPLFLAAFDPSIWIYVMALFAVSGFWFLKVNSVYGDPLHMPSTMSAVNMNDVTGWFVALNHRPHAILLFSFGTIILCPLFAFALLVWPQAYRRFAGVTQDKESLAVFFLWIWTLVFFVYLADFKGLFGMGNKEHRYFYQAYPAICLLAAYAINSIRVNLSKKKINSWLLDMIVVAGILMITFYTFPLAFDKACSISMLF